MRSKSGLIGDFTPEFNLSVFFPARLQQPVILVSDFSFAVFNMCGFVNIVRRYLEGKSEEPKVEEPPKKIIEKKKALDFLDQEIKSLTKKEEAKIVKKPV